MNSSLFGSRLSAAGILALASLVFPDGHNIRAQSASSSLTALSAARALSLPASDTKAFTTTGPLVAEQQSDVAAERDGRVVQIAVEIGDRVQPGQVLASLDDRTLRADCDAQNARVASLQAQVRDWQAEQKSVEADLRRADQLRADQVISLESWEHVKYKLDETIAEVERHRADETAAENEMNGDRLRLEQSRILAPFAGVVGRSSVRMGQQVKQGDVLFWITAMSPLRILFTVPESVMSKFITGGRLELATPDYPGLRQPARILRVSPVVDPGSGSVQIVGVVVHPSPLLKPGMSMQVRLAP